ncbi:MAG: hypothetical protein ACHQNT_03655 [Bacteroidia bacterium]
MRIHFALLFCTSVLFSSSAFAQKPIVVEEVIKEMSRGMQTGYEVLIPEITLRDAKSALSKYLRKDSRGKVEEAKGELFINGAVNKNISADLFTVYSKLLETDDGVKLTAFFTENDTLFFTSSLNPDQGIAIKKYLRDFALMQYRDLVKKDLETQERKQKELEHQLGELIKAKQKSERVISESKRTIENNKKEIALNNQQDNDKAAAVLSQKQIVSSLKGSGGEEEKVAEKTLKNLQNDKRKLEKEKESLEREIDKLTIRIEDEQRSIENNLKAQEGKNNEIEKQKVKVKITEVKLNTIL